MSTRTAPGGDGPRGPPAGLHTPPNTTDRFPASRKTPDRPGNLSSSATLVSFRQYVDWMDVQKPEVLEKLRTLDVGTQPVGGWKTFLADMQKSSTSAAGGTGQAA